MNINKDKYTFDDFVEVIKILRSPEGCPWDKEQTHESLKGNLIEESYEFLSEIDKNNIDGMREELGDVLLQVLLHSQIAKDENEFDINDVIDGITKKMIFRHPHVFGDKKADDGEKAYDIFKEQKNKEKHFTKQVDVLKSIPDSFPALMKSQKTVSKLTKLQPDFFKKSVEENINKLKQMVTVLDNSLTEEELGNILQQISFLAKAADIDSEIALSNANKKIVTKFEKIEDEIIIDDKDITQITAEEFEKYWHN